MGFLARLLSKRAPRAESRAFNGLTDPAFYEFVRSGGASRRAALEVSAVFRCVSLLTGVIASLPLRPVEIKPDGTAGLPMTGHPLHDILMFEPNGFQSAHAFKRLMQLRMFTHGNAYARIVRTMGRVTALIPIDPETVTPRQTGDGSIVYEVKGANDARTLPQADVFHLFGLSTDGFTGLAPVRLAEDAVGLSRQAAQALSRIYKTGVSASGALTHPHKLSPEAKANLKAGLDSYSGSANAGRWLVLDEGMKAEVLAHSARDSQTLETIAHQIEDIARFFGVPRPLMGIDDTSWGSGVEQLAILFTRFDLAPWFDAWEQAVRRSLLTREERRSIRADFDERELLRGTMKDQADYFAKALGAGGGFGWATQNEVRDVTGAPRHPDGDTLPQPQRKTDVPAQAS